MQQRQDWLSNYLQDNHFERLEFVGRYKGIFDILKIVNDIRSTLNLNETWASEFGTWEESLNKLTEKIEDTGIITVFNGVVENNVYRKIAVDECRGFVLVDDFAPFMFINNADSKAAQMFTIVHELAHIWTGHSAGFDFRKLQPADDRIEVLCDKVAAEFLVSKNAFTNFWANYPVIKKAARHFKVSELVIARRALDTGKITKKEFFGFYDEYKKREFVKKENSASGGNFYATTRKRLSPTFAAHINNAVNAGQLLHRDAYKLTSLKGDTFKTFFSEHL
jgi:Zn-dependent peptidase ImmA (M78 family)